METQEIRHYQINQRYKIQFEVGAVKGVTGWKIEANGDDMAQVVKDAGFLKAHGDQPGRKNLCA
jgi:hypothetical protein